MPVDVIVAEYPEPDDISDDGASEVDRLGPEFDDGPEAYYTTEDEGTLADGEFDTNNDDLVHEDQEEDNQEDDAYEQPDGYSEGTGYSEDPHPDPLAFWNDEDTGLGYMYDFDGSEDPYGGYYDDFEYPAADVYFDGYHSYGEWFENNTEWEEDTEGDYDSDYGYDDYGYDHEEHYGYDDYAENLDIDFGYAYQDDF
ncbi:hypothetical protein RSOLAG1IB_08374 [Rhizoctonia solani AG-1 IB]|uniref:Uncharacterized protein n=1 Tax=Thanatephorus cucumeris (strain AG1-IB / isolate 7/3/14) TaxID=1108050 RepID=A0A0B7FLV7_THACB|nr:hypothetical protein RSOLAG1IB_08374 [Rhizoctonia solani AG-1 IB]